jgi:RNA 2',3'-cyclic 3'-phosphodiesterase
VRLFVAINLHRAERERIHRATAVLRAAGFPIRWTATESLHLTIEFLGESDESSAIRIENVLRDVAADCSPFAMAIAGIGAFPGLGRPRVLWVGVEPAAALIDLHARVARGLGGLGFRIDERPFHPHITIGRAQAIAVAAHFRGLAELAPRIRVEAATTVQSIDLMRSRLSPAGAHYECLIAVGLGGTTGPAAANQGEQEP